MQNSTVIGKLMGDWSIYMIKRDSIFWLDPHCGTLWPMTNLGSNTTRKIIAVIPEWV